MKYFLLNILILSFALGPLSAQDLVEHRIILIGNAGSITPEQKFVLDNALKQIVHGKTIALFLGNNVYPAGMQLTENKRRPASHEILRSQFEAFRKKGVPVYFIPGIADWDNDGPDGYKKMVQFNEFIRAQNDSLLQIIPHDACPGPYELPLGNNVVVVAIDSEWWLFPFDKHIEESECECKTKRDVLNKLNDVIERNNNKIIFFATNHPFKSYGVRGGYYPLKRHLFPLATANRNLFVPLPVVGSVYPIFREIFPSITDTRNPVYQDMKVEITNILKQHANILHVSAHEQSLQLIKGDILEVISGAATKITPVKKGDSSLYAESVQGFVVADVLKNKTLNLSFNKIKNKDAGVSYVYQRVFTKPPVIIDEVIVDSVKASNITTALNGDYDKVSGFHRSLFGENYRKVWATKTTFPVLRLSATDLQPKELGGGFQTHSLRLLDKQKKEWVFRSIEKYPAAVLPGLLNKSFAVGFLTDNVSATLPYAPLTVPVFADALGVPHTNSKIVYVAPDKKLGIYSKDFANTLNLFEEREPLGKSISTINMIAELKKDNDNSIDQPAFLNARLLDIFLADWDRHGDQWRWVDVMKGKGKTFKAVPRDRDQVFYVNEGLFLKLLALPWVLPKFQGFSERIKNINALSFNARFIDGLFTNQLSFSDWMIATEGVVNKLTDSVIQTALKKMPTEIQQKAHAKLSNQLQKRRQDLLRTAPVYHRFLNKIVDVTLSDKNEFVSIKDTLDDKLKVTVFKINKRKEVEKEIFNRVFEPSVTKEVRLFLHAGLDSIALNNNGSPIKLRIVGNDTSSKMYTINGRQKYLKKVHIYEGKSNASFNVESGRAHLHLSNDAGNISFQTTSRYNKTIPSLNIGFNVDDGLILGAGVKWTKQAFRKEPYGSSQQLSLAHSFSTSAYKFNYRGEWLQVFGKADLVMQAKVLSPNNTQNFFGRGNGTSFNKTGDYKRFYRTRFNFYEVVPSVRWHIAKRDNLTAGPGLQYYHYDEKGNEGRFIIKGSKIGSYDSSTIANDKSHAGVITAFTHDSRNNILLPTYGCFINTAIQAYQGLNNFSKSFIQLATQLAFYKSVDRKSTLVVANRIGGGVTVGKTAFYQSLFLGGHENLWGYHQYRFAGEQMLYNNLEARLKLADVASYTLPGQLGLIGLYDVGRVWQKGFNNNDTWRQGVGGGLYFAPANIAVLQFVIAKSDEGVYPYLSMGFRF